MANPSPTGAYVNKIKLELSYHLIHFALVRHIPLNVFSILQNNKPYNIAKTILHGTVILPLYLK